MADRDEKTSKRTRLRVITPDALVGLCQAYGIIKPGRPSEINANLLTPGPSNENVQNVRNVQNVQPELSDGVTNVTPSNIGREPDPELLDEQAELIPTDADDVEVI